MGNAFYRWDGFKYYALFSDFLPSIALASVLWSIIALLTAALLWLIFRSFEWFCNRIGVEIRTEHLLLHAFYFVLFGVLAWKVKTYKWPEVQTTTNLKFAVLICVALISIFPVRLFRKKAAKWISNVQDRITPLVWLFGMIVLLSVPLVIYHTWINGADKVTPQGIIQSTVSDKSRPNIILVTFDVLTARNMSVYGYQKLTTPFISEWAGKASLFKRFKAESNATGPTTASLMTGKRVWTHQRYDSQVYGFNPAKSDTENLALILKRNGYYTIALIQNPAASVRTLGISHSFDIAPITSEFYVPSNLYGIVSKRLYRLFSYKIRVYDWILSKDFILGNLLYKISDILETEYPPEKAFNSLLEVIDNNVKEPFFAWIHLFPPHAPYLTPEPFVGMFDPSDEMRTFKSLEQGEIGIRKYLSIHQNFPRDIQIFRSRFDEFITYCDKQFEEFIEQLTIRNALKNTVIIFSSDHGEIFEHEYLLHRGPHLYEPLTHVPLIIKEPGQTEGLIIDELVDQIDVPATILDLADIPIAEWIEGRSLLPLMRGKEIQSKPVFSMSLEKNPSRGHQITKGTIAVWKDDYKLIHYLEKDKSLLFNLKKDPDEIVNLIEEEPEIGKHLLGLIQDNLEEANERIRTGSE
jgi:arylsulfatase A-like enzyme